MTRKLLIISVALLGFTLASGSNAWADHDRGKKGKRHHYDKGYHQSQKESHGHHYGWHKGKGYQHKDRYQHRREHRQWDRDHHYHNRYQRRDRHRDHHYKGRHHRKPVVEKHVYHHYPKRHRYDGDRSNITFTVIDQVLGIAVAVSKTH